MRRLGPVLVVLLAGGCRPARLRQFVTPVYPMMLRSAQIEGRVRVRISVSSRGVPERIRFDSTDGAKSLFATAVERAVRHSVFTPARHFGVPVHGTLEFPVRFVLLRPTTPPDAWGPDRLDSLPARCPPPSEPKEVVVCTHGERPRAVILY